MKRAYDTTAFEKATTEAKTKSDHCRDRRWLASRGTNKATGLRPIPHSASRLWICSQEGRRIVEPITDESKIQACRRSLHGCRAWTRFQCGNQSIHNVMSTFYEPVDVRGVSVMSHRKQIFRTCYVHVKKTDDNENRDQQTSEGKQWAQTERQLET